MSAAVRTREALRINGGSALEGVGAESFEKCPAKIRKYVVSFGGKQMTRNLAGHRPALEIWRRFIFDEQFVEAPCPFDCFD